jgi:hypothetical protein
MKFLRVNSISTGLILAVFYFVLLGIVSLYLGQDISWDIRNYHFYNPYMFLTGRMQYDILPAQIQTFLNPTMDIPFFVAIYYLKIHPAIVGFVLGGIHGLNIWMVHQFVYFSTTASISNASKHFLGFIAAVTSIRGAGYLSVLGTTIGDSTISLFVLGSLLILTYYLSKEKPISRDKIFLAGLVLGLGVGLKLTAAIYVISLGVAINFIKNTWQEKVKNFVTLVLGIILGFFSIASYWMILMQRNFSSALFPFYNKIFKSPYIETDYNLEDLRFLPKDLPQSLFYPFYFTNDPPLVAELDFKEIRFIIIYLLFALLLLVGLFRITSKKRSPFIPLVKPSIFALIISFYLTSYLVWLSKFSIYRYLVSLELITPVVIILIVGFIYPFKRQLILICLYLFSMIFFAAQPIDWWRIPWSDNYFGIDSAPLIAYEKSVILMADPDQPTAFIVPYFPESTRFVRISGNMGLSEETLFHRRAQEIVANTATSDLYFLDADIKNQREIKTKELLNYNLIPDYSNCKILPTNVGKYSICPVIKNLP